jgi:Ca-activated chloride channel family protein
MLTIEKPKFQETNLWDACIYALSKLEKAKYQKRILLIYSDGMNNVHENSFKKVRERLKESDALVYFVGLIDGKDQNSIMSFQGQSFLSALSFISGGSGFFPQNQKEIDEITERIALTIRRQYVIGYAPKENTKKEKWRNVIVKSAALSEKGKKVSFSVIAREGYFVK